MLHFVGHVGMRGVACDSAIATDKPLIRVASIIARSKDIADIRRALPSQTTPRLHIDLAHRPLRATGRRERRSITQFSRSNLMHLDAAISTLSAIRRHLNTSSARMSFSRVCCASPIVPRTRDSVLHSRVIGRVTSGSSPGSICDVAIIIRRLSRKRRFPISRAIQRYRLLGVESRGNSHTTRTMRRRAVPDTKPWHREPSPRTTTSPDVREDPPTPGAACTSALSQLPPWPRVASHLSAHVRTGAADHQAEIGQLRGR